VSATIQSRGHPTQILAAWWADAFELVTSNSILNDLRRVLFYPHIRKRHNWSDEQIALFVDSIALATTRTPGILTVRAVKNDPADDKILACAQEGNVDFVVASDEHLTKLGSYSGIPIVSPRLFLEILDEQQR
jgi:uncharacterized protein